jgi:hypothetical protein
VCLLLQSVSTGRGIGLLAHRDLHGRVLALIASVANDLRHGAHEAHVEALLARARLQSARPRTAAPRSTVYYVLGGRPSLGPGHIDARAVGACEEGGGGGVLVLLGSVGRGLEKVAEVVVGLDGLALGLGRRRIVVRGDLGAPATLGEELAGRLARVDHGAAGRTSGGGECTGDARVQRRRASCVENARVLGFGGWWSSDVGPEGERRGRNRVLLHETTGDHARCQCLLCRRARVNERSGGEQRRRTDDLQAGQGRAMSCNWR